MGRPGGGWPGRSASPHRPKPWLLVVVPRICEPVNELDAVLGDMIGRCRVLKLRIVGGERQLLTDFMVLLTARTMEFIARHGRSDWIAV